MRTHLRIGRSGDVACGRGGYDPRSTRSAGDVDCQRCMRTAAYFLAQSQVQSITTVDPVYNGHPDATLLDETQQAIKVVLDAFIQRAHQEAEEAGYCSTYDEIIDQASMVLPTWYEVPGKTETFELNVNYDYREVRATGEDEVYALIAADPRKYITL